MVRHSIFAIGVLSMLTGYAAVVQDVPAPWGSYFERELKSATIKGVVLTIIAGKPFGGLQKDFDNLVRRLMYGQNRELPADFVASHNERPTPPYKVVVAFNKDRGMSSNLMCADPGALRSEPQEKPLRIDIVFCHGDVAKSDTGGYASNVSKQRS